MVIQGVVILGHLEPGKQIPFKQGFYALKK
jgi:hypothetical protein